MPNNLGIWVLARNRVRPYLNPTIKLSEMKLTMDPALASQAMKTINATSSAVPAASAPKCVGSPPAMPPCDAPTKREMAEVTVMAVCRELQNSQKTRPSNKHA